MVLTKAGITRAQLNAMPVAVSSPADIRHTRTCTHIREVRSSGLGVNSSYQGVEKAACRLFKKVQIRGARENRRAEAYLPIRWSEAIERNEVGGPFSTAC